MSLRPEPGKHVAPDELREMARDALRSSDELNETDSSRPETVDAGPFTPLVLDLMEATAAHAADLVMRMHTLGGRLREAADYYEYDEQLRAHDLEEGFFGGARWALDNPGPVKADLLDELRGTDADS